MSNYDSICVIHNGARFHNVDLHIHSYGASHDVRDAAMTPEAIVDSAVKQGLSVIAITDHNSNANVERAIAHAQEHHAGRILVVPGVEVTTAHGHLLAYFAPDRTTDLEKFLSRLDLIGERGDDNTRTAKSMADTIAEAEKLHGICIAAHIDREKTGFDMFAPGFQNWKKDILTSTGLYGLECDAIATLSWYSETDEAGAAGVERKKMLDARKMVEGLRARHHFAHVQGSDSHSMKRFEHQDPSKPWTRIKLAELTFGALRVALIDPTARVRACASVPRSIPRIRGIAMVGGFLHGESIHFADNLNCFIGGRGTGKSTAIRALAYAFGQHEDFGEYQNCPDSVIVYCEDANGVLYRYSRSKGGDIDAKAKEGAAGIPAPVDSFRIEYFGQGELAKVAEDPLKNPHLFQEFLDRHTHLRDLIETESSLITGLNENAGRLNQLEIAFWQLNEKKKTLGEIEKKLKVAEEGNLREVVSAQSKVASEKTIRGAAETIVTEYTAGFVFSGMERDYAKIAATAGECTTDATSKAALESIHLLLDTNNAALRVKAAEVNALLRQCAKELAAQVAALKANHNRLDNEVALKVAELKARGLAAGNIAELEQLIRQKTTVGREIATVELKANDLKTCREERMKLLKDLKETRDKMSELRKAQLRGINANLGLTIKDYTVFVKYDDEGIIDEFFAYMQTALNGTYLQDPIIQSVCKRVTPSELSDLIRTRDPASIATKAKITSEQADKIVSQMCRWKMLFELQVLAKHPKPIITVRTKSVPPQDIPVFNLSDGQRHTILLTIAMLADSNVPLVIDQPEDDLDNAFIFSSIVATLRAIKERRQVILVTHNANIAVLGDSELLLPMHREKDCGKAMERGSIDSEATRMWVQNILEGSPAAFLRRKEIYGH